MPFQSSTAFRIWEAGRFSMRFSMWLSVSKNNLCWFFILSVAWSSSTQTWKQNICIKYSVFLFSIITLSRISLKKGTWEEKKKKIMLGYYYCIQLETKPLCVHLTPQNLFVFSLQNIPEILLFIILVSLLNSQPIVQVLYHPNSQLLHTNISLNEKNVFSGYFRNFLHIAEK